MTGGCVHDADRRLSRAARLAELAGVRWLGANYKVPERAGRTMVPLRSSGAGGLPLLAAAPFARVQALGATVLATDPAGAPVLTRHEVGRGAVYFFADPVELAPEAEGARLRQLYGWFLESAGIPRLPVTPDLADLHLFAQKTRCGRVHVVFNRRQGSAFMDAKLETRAGKLTLRVQDRYPALAAVTDAGEVTAVGAYRQAGIAEEEFFAGDDFAMVAALDDLDVRKSSALMVLPFAAGRIRLSSARSWKRPVLVLGEFRAGEFRELERVPGPIQKAPAPTAGVLSAELDADRATLVGILCEESAAEKWREYLAALMTAPERA
jgi:hypothetical protein